MVIDPKPSPPATQPRLPIGVLIMGEAGIGKSAIALELIDRGHALVADDAPLFQNNADGQLYGHCPAALQDILALRALGLLNIRQLHGEQAIHTTHPLDLIIKINQTPPMPENASHTCLHGDWQDQCVLEHRIPQLNLTMSTPTHLALLIETAARLHLIQRSGYNAADDISARLDNLLTQAAAESSRLT